jgi:iron complex outermembrane receptor protein
MRTYLSALVMVFITTLANAQERCNLILSGQVTDGETGKALAGAEIAFAGRQVFSDATGKYDFHDVCPSNGEISCKYPGFKTLRYNISLTESRIENILLHNDTCVLESVIVRGKKIKIESRRSQSIDTEKMIQREGLSLGEQLKELDGVTVIQTGPTIFKPVVQGLYGQRVMILNNGIRQEGQQWGSEHAPEIDPFVFERISLVKGAASVRYGSEAIGGVILLESKPFRRSNGIEGAFQVGGFENNRMLSSAVRIEGTYKSFSARIQGSTRQAGDSKSPNYVLSNTAFNEYNFSYAIAYQKRKIGAEIFYSQFNTKVGILSAAHIGNLTDLNLAISSDKPLTIEPWTREVGRPYQQVSHEMLKVQAFLRPASWAKVVASYSMQYNDRKEYDKHRPFNDSLAALNKPELDLHITTQSVQAVLEHSFHHEQSGSLGIFYANQENVSLGRPFIPNFESNSYAVFLTEAWQHKRIQFEMGGRLEKKTMTAYFFRANELQTPNRVFNNSAIHLGGNYEIRTNLKLYINLSTGFRPPHVSELFSNGVHHGTASVEIGDSTLGTEKAYSASASLPFSIKKIQGEIMVYHNYIEDFIYLKPSFPSTLTIRGAFPTFRYTQENARFTGVDFSVKDTVVKSLVIKLKTSILNSRLTRSNEVLFMSPPTRAEAEVRYLFKSNEKIHNPFIQCGIQHTFRKTDLKENQDYAPAPDAYTLMNLETGVRIEKGKSSWWLSAGCNNVLNIRYRDYLDRFRYYADAPGRSLFMRLRIDINRHEKQ